MKDKLKKFQPYFDKFIQMFDKTRSFVAKIQLI